MKKLFAALIVAVTFLLISCMGPQIKPGEVLSVVTVSQGKVLKIDGRNPSEFQRGMMAYYYVSPGTHSFDLENQDMAIPLGSAKKGSITTSTSLGLNSTGTVTHDFIPGRQYVIKKKFSLVGGKNMFYIEEKK